jgi:hypothetical protein
MLTHMFALSDIEHVDPVCHNSADIPFEGLFKFRHIYDLHCKNNSPIVLVLLLLNSRID